MRAPRFAPRPSGARSSGAGGRSGWQGRADARIFGAKDFVLWTDSKAMAEHERACDLVLRTVPEWHDLNPKVKTLKRDGTLVVVGLLGPYAI